MKAILVSLVLASIVVGGIAVLTPGIQPPWSHGRNHQCEMKCPYGYCPVDLTPQNKNDCHYACLAC